MSCKEQIIHFFSGIGFRPAVWVDQRDQYGDYKTLIIGDDSPCGGKLDMNVFGLFPKEYNGSLDWYSYGPDLSAVTLPQGILLMLTCIGAIALTKYSKAIGEWFTAERGAGEGKNGWV